MSATPDGGGAPDRQARGTSRRGLFAGAAGVAATGLLAAGSTARSSPPPKPAATVPFHGPYQAGIATPAQDRLVFASFDVTAGRAELVDLLRTWTDAARRMTAGAPVGDVAGEPLAPPADTGEAAGLAPGRLTLTIGFGPSLFDGRFGLSGRRPAALADLPALPGDELEPQRCGGDLAVQACSDDPQVAFHAVRNLVRLGRGTVVPRWMQLGFGRTATTSRQQDTPRNLMGFKDGTNNIRAEDTGAMTDHVWVGSDTDQQWMRGGTYLVTRRIRMLIESWDRASLSEQERVVGRQKVSGAPIGASRETDAVDLSARGPDGTPRIDGDAHIRLAAPAQNDGQRILRRGYSYTDGMDVRTGALDAGLFFICFQRDPRRAFVPIQRKLGAHDAMSEYLKHTGSAVFACPPGIDAGQWWGHTLFT